MKKIRIFIASIIAVFSIALVPVSANAVSVLPQCTDSQVTSAIGSSDDICASSKNDNVQNIIKNVVDILLYIIGVVSVIMIIVGGFRYVTSAGNSNSVTAAKNTIMYALIGLVVAVLAYVIVGFVITAVTTGKST